ncbi:MAG TPA: hypothetical protein VKP59_05180 [Candidatus Thermoplasmatota archaeon]|nr:hypothetical protein [Candidatus Thermoplasmatota archaeon]
MDEKTQKRLEGLGFTEIKDKKGLYKKQIKEGTAFWDFRKTKKGQFYVATTNGEFLDTKKAKQLDEYLVIRKNGNNFKTGKEIKQKNQLATITETNMMRGGEENIRNTIMERNLDLIIKASPNPKNPGEGILFYDRKIGKFNLCEPSVEMVDMITTAMGHITTEIIDTGMHRIVDPDGETIVTYYAIVKATDQQTKTSGLGTAEEIIDFDAMKDKNNEYTNKTFALTNAIRKAERNAKERLIPVPRKAMVELMKEILHNRKK